MDYKHQHGKLEVIKQSNLIPIEQLSWDCLSIEAQGYGVIQMCRALEVVPNQTKREFYKGFLAAYGKYLQKEKKKHENFAKRFINPDSINW